MSDEAAIREVVETWMAASWRGDRATVLGLMTDDVVFMIPGEEPFGKAEFEARSEGMNDLGVEGTNEIVEMQVLGTWAYLRCRIDMAAAMPGGQPVHHSGHALTILRKENDGRWRVARDANLMIAHL